MYKLIPFLCFSCLIYVVYSFELHDFRNEDDAVNQAYDVKNLARKSLSNFQNYHRFKSEPIHLQTQSVYENFADGSLENVLGNSTKCFRDFIYIAENLDGSSGQWALKMLDSYGKLGSGFLVGATDWVGEYTECTQVYAPPKLNTTTGDFHGQYCSLTYSIKLGNFFLSIKSGACLPDSCLSSEIPTDVARFLHPVVDVTRSNESEFDMNVTMACKPTKRHLNAPAKAVITLLSLFCALAIFGSSVTAVKYFMEKVNTSSLQTNSDVDNELPLLHNKSRATFYDYWKKCEPFFECFCMFRNGAKLLNTTGGEGELICVHGIRFLSMSWVILGHTYVFSFANLRNVLDVFELANTFAFQIVMQGFFSVDSFFVLSGFLLTYLFMKQSSKSPEGISWPYFYIHRYLRLTPVYMIVLGFSATVYLYVGSGPFWLVNDVDPVCKERWWWNLLYFNNFGDWNHQCMGWSWYLANDMQFFVISPLFLITLWRWPKIGYSLVALFLCASWASNFIITYKFDLPPGMATILNHSIADIKETTAKVMDYFSMVYSKPYTRIGPYLIGMLTGCILFERKRNDKTKHSWGFLILGWTVASTITLISVYGLYDSNSSVVANSFYNALSRTTFAVGLSWVIYICLIDQGGFVNSILSYKMFIPLSRLTYSAYLIHPMIISGYYSNLKVYIQFSHPTMVFLFLGFVVATYALALPVALVLESPIIALEKLIRNSFSKKKDECAQ